LHQLMVHSDKTIYEKKLFLNPDFSKRDLAIELSTNRTYITEAISTCRQCNWNGYVNSFRVRYFVEMVATWKKRHLKVEEMAALCGFKTARNLNRYLKKEYGITAAVYRKNLSTSLRAEGNAKTATLS